MDLKLIKPPFDFSSTLNNLMTLKTNKVLSKADPESLILVPLE
jgi:hypothetical protein